MSVQTEADEALEKAQSAVNSAIYELSKIIISECHGADDFKYEFRVSMQSCLVDLLQIRQKLK